MENSTRESSQQTYRRLFWLLLCAVTLFRMAIAGSLGLGTDESHYVLFSRHLAWGYFDHPPMVAFLAALTTLFGDGLFFIRLGPIICSAISLVLLRFLALALYRDERVAFWAAVLLLFMPYQHLLTVALLPDATLNLFWCGTLLALWHAMQDRKWPVWVLVGLLFGGALLSKYHAVLLPLCVLFYLLTSPSRRFWLGRIQPYVAGLIGLIVFTPNIIWNARHNWISYAYQLAHGGSGHFSPGKLLGAFGGQMGAWSPVIFGLLIAAFIVMAREKPFSESDRFVFWTSLPVFVFFCGIGAFGKILPHWPSVGWWTGSLAVTTVTLRKISPRDNAGIRWRHWCVAAAITGFVMISFLYTVAFVPIVGRLYSHARSISMRLNQHLPAIKPMQPFKSKYDITNRLFGWEEIAERVEAIREEMACPERTFVFCHRFFTTSQLAVYLHPETVATSLHHKFNQYRFWFHAEDYVGWDALFVDDNLYFQGPKRYLPLFRKVDPEPVEIKVFRKDQLAQEIRVYRYYGFKGRFEEK
jgi:hypothetical protein